MAELPGSFGKYFLCDKIAAGGMAEIYLAKLIGPGGFEKQLVLKQISPELSKQRQFVELFVAEAKTLVSLSHGNIVPVYELGVIEDTYFIAMEYVDGPTLGELMAALEERGERLEPAVAAHIASELCKGLDYAHRKGEGVVHRDLSPRNVLLSRDGEVKLVDFGLALTGGRAQPAGRHAPPGAARAEHPGDRSGEHADARPVAALPAGSFPYMSPEQVRCEPLDARSDLFSLGVLLWEMLVGAHLFARADADATLAAVLEQPIAPPSGVHGGVPVELDRLCLRALERDRDERFGSAGEILSGLARFGYSVEPPVTQGTLAALIARVCPPVARRPGTAGQAESEPSSEGGHTRPIGTRRRRSAAMQTFATSEQFDQVLANATPLMAFPALGEVAARRMAELAPRPGQSAALVAAPEPPRWRRWAAAGVAAVGAAALGAALTSSGRGDQAGPARASSGPGDQAGPAPAAEPVPPAAVAPAGAAPASAAVPAPIPTAPPVREPGSTATATLPPAAQAPTGSPAPASIAAASGKERRPRGQGTLQVGANPWADVYVDGALVGQAPGSWPVAAGSHAVEVRYRAERRSFRVAIDPGETAALGLVDFTVP